MNEEKQLLIGLGELPDTQLAVEPIENKMPCPPWFSPATAVGQQLTHVAMGLHPTGRLMSPLKTKKCRDCRHIQKAKDTRCLHGGRTRATWPACDLLQQDT
jgi:hypothetical protein